MDIKFYNSLSNKVEAFIPLKEKEVSLYVCGPTVYNYPHIGNFRPVIIFDTLTKFFENVNYKVHYVSNYTDVDDRIIDKAIKEGVSEKVITDFYIDSFEETLQALNVKKADLNPRVTDYIPQIVDYISHLIEKKGAYVKEGEVFFSVESVKDYGALSKINLDDLYSGARVEENSKKNNPLDFLLWKDTKEGIKWKTPWCEGRPGWHTECCVMIDSIFNGKIDIHGGGMDLKFPHHENEIAQAEIMHHNKIANYWIHNGMVNLDGVKMSKSEGNVILAKDAIKLYGADTLRLAILNAPYRSVINISNKTIDDTNSILQKFSNCYKQANLLLEINKIKESNDNIKLIPFLEALADDINIPNGVTYLLDLIKIGRAHV